MITQERKIMLIRHSLKSHGIWLRCIGVLVFLLGYPAWSLAAQNDSSKSQPSASGAMPGSALLRVGISANAPPLAYRQGDTLVGVEPELAKELGAFLGRKVSFVELKWKDQIPALLENRTDIIMSGMTITSMRKIRIAFSQPYFRTGQMALIHEKARTRFPDSYYGILGQASLLKIGVVKGTTGELFVKRDFASARKIIPFKTSSIALEDLKKGDIDLLIHDAPVILWLASENEANGLVPLPSLMTEEYLAWGIRKDDEAMQSAVNQFINEIRQQKKLHEILYRWIPFLK
jgi:polar amino acid transport system substrate-binding protein